MALPTDVEEPHSLLVNVYRNAVSKDVFSLLRSPDSIL